MENQNNSKQDCGCGNDCHCSSTSSSSSWRKWVFVAIIFVTAAIIMVKFVGNDKTKHDKCCHKHENSSCCHHTNTDNDE